jgi:hypothetical protein
MDNVRGARTPIADINGLYVEWRFHDDIEEVG